MPREDVPPFVIAGLDPAIHAAGPLPKMVGFELRRVGMDHRVKPGGDEEKALLHPPPR